MSDSTSLALPLARWTEARLHETIGFCLRGSRLYGLEVIDPTGLEADGVVAARLSFIAEAADDGALLRLPEARRALDFDAAALVSLEWRSFAGAGMARPGEFSVRRRARVVHVLTSDGAATVTRFEHEPEFVVLAGAS